ncbi:MAG: ABC transporter ATP-binding protein [Cyclobacteriaceae bacterium]|nr:ABC transporter ATP-binding protein [Cyclobacteriaceae bacterium]
MEPIANNRKNLLEVRNLQKQYGSNGKTNVIFEDLNLTIYENEFVAILGHSGSGKSTLLRMIAGLEHIDGGHLSIEGKDITGPGKERMMIFQNYALLPWLSVYDNIKLAVDEVMSEASEKEKKAHIKEHIAMVHLEDATHKKPSELSGGMKQRVGIARALAVQPLLLLMDEPLGALDPFTRAKLQDQILELYYERHQTIMLVTHDVEEALLMADRIIVLKVDEVASIGKVIDVPFEHPRDRKKLRESPQFNELRNETLSLMESYFEQMQTNNKKMEVSQFI